MEQNGHDTVDRRSSVPLILFAGLALTIIGATKTVLTGFGQASIAADFQHLAMLCLHGQTGLASDMALAGHCWGCPVALAGVGLMLIAALLPFTRDGENNPIRETASA